MGKGSSSEGKPQKTREKVITRARAQRELSHGADPAKYTKHSNYHIRRYCWRLMGRPLPENMEEQNKFLATLQGMETPKDATALPGFYMLVRQRILKEVPVKQSEAAAES